MLFIPRFIAFEVPAGSCGLCRTEQRRDLNNLDPDPQRNAALQRQLAALLEQYLTGEIVAAHRRNLMPWHGPGTLFFPGHRGYIGGFEIWLLNVEGRPEFVPLPKWDPANPIPFFQDGMNFAFRGTDTDACTTSDAGPGANCSGIENFNINRPLPDSFKPSGGLCAYESIEQLQKGDGGRPGLEGSYHNPVHNAVGGTMGQVFVASSALVFWPWHAFIDDVSQQYESACRGSTPACTDVFPRLPASQSAAIRASSASAESPAHVRAPLGFWWWFEDVVTPPEVSPAVVVDHSGFNFEGSVRGGAKLVPGLVGQALQLDGRDDFVEIRDPTVGEVGSSDFTLDAWIKTMAGGVQPIVDKQNARGVGYALFLEKGSSASPLGRIASSACSWRQPEALRTGSGTMWLRSSTVMKPMLARSLWTGRSSYGSTRGAWATTPRARVGC